MRKLLPVVALLPVLVFGTGFSFGASPKSQTATLQFAFPTWVAIWVQNDVTWDFSNIQSNAANPEYPPDISAGHNFPQYYYPTDPNSSPYLVIRYWTNAAAATNWQLTVAGDADPATWLPLSDIEYSDAGAGSWTALSTTANPIRSGAGNTGGFENADQDWRVNITGDEEEGNVSCTVTYTMETL